MYSHFIPTTMFIASNISVDESAIKTLYHRPIIQKMGSYVSIHFIFNNFCSGDVVFTDKANIATKSPNQEKPRLALLEGGVTTCKINRIYKLVGE
jgi:hypothetical protein